MISQEKLVRIQTKIANCYNVMERLHNGDRNDFGMTEAEFENFQFQIEACLAQIDEIETTLDEVEFKLGPKLGPM